MKNIEKYEMENLYKVLSFVNFGVNKISKPVNEKGRYFKI